MRHIERLPLVIFLVFTGFYLLTMSGHTYSADEETMIAVAQSMLRRGDVAVVVEDGAPIAALRPGPDGRGYSPYGVLPSLLALPFVALGELAAPLGPAAVEFSARFAVSTLNAPITAATAALLAAWVLRLGAGRTTALALALSYGLASFAWPYARTFFSEPLAALLILIAAERAERAFTQGAGDRGQGAGDRGQAAGVLFVSGLAAGLLLATRIAAGVALPVLGLYVAWGAWRFRSVPVWTRLVGAWLLGLLPGLALIGWYNWARFGTLLATGYASESGLFTTPLLEGLTGLLFSPGKSVLLYAPALLLAVPGAVALWRRGRADLVLLCVGLFLGHLLLYARWGEWEGGGVWGPRFLLPVVAVTLILAAGLGHSSKRPLQRSAVATKTAGAEASATLAPALSLLILSLIGFSGNLGGVLLNFNTYLNTPNTPDKIWSVAGSPLLAHWQILGERWGRYLSPPPHCALGDGFFATEAVDGAALPRRTGALGVVRCAAAAPMRLSFALDDRRPPEAPPSELQLTMNGRDLGPTPGGQLRIYRVLLPAGSARLTIAVQSWNPRTVGFSERDDNLGPQVALFRGVTADGAALALIDTAIAPLPERPRPRWAWYYDPPNQHLVDHWAWYIQRTELVGPVGFLLGALIVGLSSGLIAAGWRWWRSPAFRTQSAPLPD